MACTFTHLQVPYNDYWSSALQSLRQHRAAHGSTNPPCGILLALLRSAGVIAGFTCGCQGGLKTASLLPSRARTVVEQGHWEKLLS